MSLLRATVAPDGKLASDRCTPPVDLGIALAGFLACGSWPYVLSSRDRSGPVTHVGLRLAAYSCGGSAGLICQRWHQLPFTVAIYMLDCLRAAVKAEASSNGFGS
jgi:hypothetical protein